jgi:uncharacterized protein
MEWLNPPPHRHQNADRLSITTGDRTDFWRHTHNDFLRDNGHLFFEQRAGDFTAEVTVRGDFRALYDQAGLMLRNDSENWIKAGIEMTGGVAYMSVVVTRTFSDWSLIPLGAAPESIRLRLTRIADAVHILYELPDGPWTPARLAYFPTMNPASIGAMACSPQRAGFEAEFRGFAIGRAVAPDPHT